MTLEPTATTFAASAATSQPRRFRFAVPLIAVLVLITFSRLFMSEFSWWDDQDTVHHNAALNPPTLQGLAYYWTTPSAGLYVPVTYTVWWLLASVASIGQPDEFGIFLNPWFFHTASVLVHLASSLLVFALLRRLLKAEMPALLGTLIFALHPVQVETVAWVSGLKDLLCWCFSLAALLLYVGRAQRIASEGGAMWRGLAMPAAAVLLVVAMLSKPTAMILPVAAWVIDGLLIRKRWMRPLIELAPLFALSFAGAGVARVVQYVDRIAAPPLWQRPFIAGDTLCFYFGKLVWPATLTIDYGRTPAVAASDPWFYARWIVPAAIVVGAIAMRRRAPILLATVALFFLGIGPVSGLATFQMQGFSTVTDHYLYFAMIGPALAIGWALVRWPTRQARAAVVIAVLALATRTWIQCGTWLDTFKLFDHAMNVNPQSYLARTNLAVCYLRMHPPRPELAVMEADAAYRINPDNYLVLQAYASAHATVGDREQAFAAWAKVHDIILAQEPNPRERASTFADIAYSLLDLREPERALEFANEAVAADPTEPHAANALVDAKKTLADKRAAEAATRPTTSATSEPSR